MLTMFIGHVSDGSSSVKKHNLFAQTPDEDHKIGLGELTLWCSSLLCWPVVLVVRCGSGQASVTMGVSLLNV